MRSKLFFSWIPFLIQMVAVPQIFAEELSLMPASRDAVVAEALAKNPEITAARERFYAAQHRVLQASALPDPTFSYMLMGEMLETRLGPQENLFEAEQMVPFPAKLWQKYKIASAEVKAAEAELAVTERDVILKVSETYYDLAAADTALRLLEEVRDSLRKFEAAAQSRYASGKGSQRDVAKAQVEVSGTLERLIMLKLVKDSTAARLNALLDRGPEFPAQTGVETPMPELFYSLEELIERGQHTRPELREAEAGVNRDRHAATLAKLEYVPDLSVGFQYSQIGSGMTTEPDDGRDAWMIPLKVNIPLWPNRIIPMVLEAKRNLKASEAGWENQENLAEYEVKDAYYRFVAARQVVELYQNALLPETELAFRSDQAGYEAGSVDILNLIDSERSYLNAKISYIQAFAEALKGFAALERAVGMDLVRKEGAPS